MRNVKRAAFEIFNDKASRGCPEQTNGDKLLSTDVSAEPIVPMNGDAAARWRSFERLIIEARVAFSDMEPDAIEVLIEEAVSATRPRLSE